MTFRIAPFGHRRGAPDDPRGARLPDAAGRARSAAPSDEDALAEALARLSAFAAANADVLENHQDVNPFIVLPKGEGAVARRDALIAVRDNDRRMSRSPVIVGAGRCADP